jgi:hypothetical protein
MDYKLNVKKKSAQNFSEVDLFEDINIGFNLDFYNVENIDKIKVPVSVDLSLPMTETNVSIIDYDPTSSQYNSVPNNAFDFELYKDGSKILEGNLYVESYSFNNNIPVVGVRLVDRLQEIFSSANELTFEDLYSDYNTLTSFDQLLSSNEGSIDTEPTRSDIILPYLDMCNDTEKFGYAARQFIQFGFDKDRAGIIPAFKVNSFLERLFAEVDTNIISKFFELGNYGTGISNNIPDDMYMVLPTKIEAGSRTRTRGFYLVNGPYDLFRDIYTADADHSLSTAKETDSYSSTNESYGWNYAQQPYSNPVDNDYGLDYKTNQRNTGDAVDKAYFGSHMSYNSIPFAYDLLTGNPRSLDTNSYIQLDIPMIKVAENNFAMVKDIYTTSTAKVAVVATLWVDGSPAQTYRMHNTDDTIKELNISDATIVERLSQLSPYRASTGTSWHQIDPSGDAPNFSFNWGIKFDDQQIGDFKWEHKEFDIVAGSTYAVSMGFEILSGVIDVQYVSSWTMGTGNKAIPSSYATKSIEDDEMIKGIFFEDPTNVGNLYLSFVSTGEHNPYFFDDDVNLYWSMNNIPYTPIEVAKEVIKRFNLSVVYDQNTNSVLLDRLTDIRDNNVEDISEKIDDASEIQVEIVRELAKTLEVKTSLNNLYYDNYGYGKETLNNAGSIELTFDLKSRVYNNSFCGQETFTEVPQGLNEYEFGFTINQFTSHKDLGITFGYIDTPKYKSRIRRGRFVVKEDYKGLIYDPIDLHAFPRFVTHKTGAMPLTHYNELGQSTDLYTFFKNNDNILYLDRPTVKFRALLDEDYAFNIKDNYSTVSMPQLNNSTLVIKSVDGNIYDRGIYADIEAIIL